MAFSKTFTYKLPDDYLAQTDNDGLTSSWTYEGPRWLFVFVDKASGKLQISQSCIGFNRQPGTEDIEHANVRAGIDQIAVQIDCSLKTQVKHLVILRKNIRFLVTIPYTMSVQILFHLIMPMLVMRSSMTLLLVNGSLLFLGSSLGSQWSNIQLHVTV